MVKSKADVLYVLTDPGVKVHEIIPISDNVIYVNWHDLKEAIASLLFIVFFHQDLNLSCTLNNVLKVVQYRNDC